MVVFFFFLSSPSLFVVVVAFVAVQTKLKSTKWDYLKEKSRNESIENVEQKIITLTQWILSFVANYQTFECRKKKTELITNLNRKMFDEFLSDTFVDNTRNLYSFFTEMFSLRWVWVPSEYLAERCTSTIHSFVPYSCIYIHRFFTSLCLHFKTLTLSTVSRRMYLSACVLFSSLFSLAYYSRGLSLSVFVLLFFTFIRRTACLFVIFHVLSCRFLFSRWVLVLFCFPFRSFVGSCVCILYTVFFFSVLLLPFVNDRNYVFILIELRLKWNRNTKQKNERKKNPTK